MQAQEVATRDVTTKAPWLFQGVPPLVAHRGDAQNCPENTQAAISAAVTAGARFIEFDVQLSKDGVPFLIHDDNLLRTAGVDLCVFDAGFSTISKVSVGERGRFGDKFVAETPVSLEDFCSQLNQWKEVHSFVEIKRQSIEYFGTETVVQKVLESLASLSTRHTLISFDHEAVALVKHFSNKSTGWVLSNWDEHSLQRLEELSPDFAFCNYQKIPKGERLPNIGTHWVLYDIADAATAVYWLNRGADLIETMAVETMMKALAGSGSRA